MPKFFQKKEHNYTKPKFNNNQKRKSWGNINVRGMNDFSDGYSTLKWLKITCMTAYESCCTDIIKEIENLCFKNTGIRTPLKPYNVLLSKNILEFYIQMKKHDIEYVFYNIYKIENYRLKCYKNEEVHVPQEIPQKWIMVIQQALKDRYRVNPTNNETELDLSNFSKDRIFLENNLVLSLSLPRLLESVLNILKTELQELTKLNLSDNGLSNLYKLKSFLIAVKITRLDISRNKLVSASDLNCLEKSSIIDLNISENNFRRIDNLKKEVRNILPNLQILNGKKLEDKVVIAGDNLKISKTLPSVIKSSMEGDCYNFVINYFEKFDMKKRDELCDFYSSDSILTLSTFGESLPQYKSINSNYYTCKDPKRRSENIKRGKGEIIGTLCQFPPTKHIKESLNVEVVNSNDVFIIVVVMGAFVELPTSKTNYRVREFTRQMIIVQGGIVLQDFIALMPNNHNLNSKYKSIIESIKKEEEFAKSHKDLENLPAQDVEIVRQFHTITGMNIPTCLRFLKAFSGFNEACEEFKKLQSQGAVPPEAFQKA